MIPGCTRCAAVVTAAGKSTRMGEYKLTLPLGGSTVLRTGLSALLRAGVTPVVVVTGHNQQLVQAHVSDLAVRCVYNEGYENGDMFSSVKAGLSALDGEEFCRVFVLPGDTPLFFEETLQSMQRAMDHTGAPVVVPSCNGKSGHPVLLCRDAAEKVLSYQGDGGLKSAFAAYGLARHVLHVDDVGTTINANSQEDYQRLLYCAHEYDSKK